MKDEIEQAHHELDRLQGIVSRHEGHMFALRGWLLTVVGGVLAAYYTGNIEVDEKYMRLGLPLIALLFLFLELRHTNLVEAVVERVSALEMLITTSREKIRQGDTSWYDGPKVSEACRAGASRWLPRRGMTFVLNLPFYVVVSLISLGATFFLPQKRKPAQAPIPAVQHADSLPPGLSTKEQSQQPHTTATKISNHESQPAKTK